jgi:hypothetical protein
MIAQTATNAFKTGLMNGDYDFSTDTFKIALYTALASLGENTAAYTSENEVSASGYSSGGATLTVTATPTISAGSTVAYISFANVSWSAAITARGALIYKYDGVDNPTVCVLDFGSDKISTSTFQVQFPTANSSNAIIRIS